MANNHVVFGISMNTLAHASSTRQTSYAFSRFQPRPYLKNKDEKRFFSFSSPRCRYLYVWIFFIIQIFCICLTSTILHGHRLLCATETPPAFCVIMWHILVIYSIFFSLHTPSISIHSTQSIVFCSLNKGTPKHKKWKWGLSSLQHKSSHDNVSLGPLWSIRDTKHISSCCVNTGLLLHTV